jgi:hypothetical protein
VAGVAVELAESSAATFAAHLRQHARPEYGDHEGQIDYVLGAIEEMARQGSRVTRSALLRACRRVDARTLDALVERLRDDGTIGVEKSTSSGGRPAMEIALRGPPA